MKCDGAHGFDVEKLNGEQREALEKAEKEGVIKPAGFLSFLAPEQVYRSYPNVFRKEAHWSITGACNLKCRHCFMSAPSAKHGHPTLEQLTGIADQLAECGVFKVAITGGEPLIREDFFGLIDALNERGITVSTIYTNGWLLDEKMLDGLEKRGVRPSWQLSFDGIGVHDKLRGVPGAEERTVRAIKLLRAHGFPVTTALCMNRLNLAVVRDSVNYLASLGVSSMKISASMVLGEWADPSVQELRLTRQEEMEFFEKYIPQFFEDNAPMCVTLAGAFSWDPAKDTWNILFRKNCPVEREASSPSCGVVTKAFYIGADGMIAPCMGMADCSYAKNFPNVFQTPLKEILGADSQFVALCNTTVGEVRDKSGKCRSCRYTDRCTGGCRNNALISSDNYYAADDEQCHFFENGWDERITAAAAPAFEDYKKRCSLKSAAGPDAR
jgi:radical SAM protein with 4Fe4S-binding SPASM domain